MEMIVRSADMASFAPPTKGEEESIMSLKDRQA